MARAAAEFLKRWTEGFQTGRQGRVERDSRLSKQRDQEGLRLLNADVESLVSQIGRPLEMQEWGSLLAKHGRTLQDAGPFVQAGIFAKPKGPVDTLERDLKETNLRLAQTKLEKLLNPTPKAEKPAAPTFVPGSEGQVYQDGKAVSIPGFQRQSPISAGGTTGPAGEVSQWGDKELLNWQQKLAPEVRVIEGVPQEIFAPGVEQIYQNIVAEIERRRGGMTPWWEGEKTFDTSGQMGFGGQQQAPRRRVFDPATGTLR